AGLVGVLSGSAAAPQPGDSSGPGGFQWAGNAAPHRRGLSSNGTATSGGPAAPIGATTAGRAFQELARATAPTAPSTGSAPNGCSAFTMPPARRAPRGSARCA